MSVSCINIVTDNPDQPTATVETLIAVLPVEDTLTPIPTKAPTKTQTDEPTETLELTDITDITDIILDPTETSVPTSIPTPSLTPYPTLTNDDFGVSMVFVSFWLVYSRISRWRF